MTTTMPRCVAWLLFAALPTIASAQSWTFPIDPRATYLRTNNDNPAPPLVLDLASLGIAPGTWLRVGSVGAFRYINGGLDNYYSLGGLFSSSATVLATSTPARVPGALASGPTVLTGGTFFGNLPTEIPEDFQCSYHPWAQDLLVRVPAGAAYLMFGALDSYYADNVDPNGDYAAVVTVQPTPTLPGTGEHLELRGGFAAPPIAFPDVHATSPGGTLAVELAYPVGQANGCLFVVAGDTITTGSLPTPSLPGLWTPNLVVLQYGLLPATPNWTTTWSLPTPGGLGGVTLVLQAGALVPTARNGLYVTTNAHRFVL